LLVTKSILAVALTSAAATARTLEQ